MTVARNARLLRVRVNLPIVGF